MKNKKYSIKKLLCIVLILGMLTFVFSSLAFAEPEYKWRFAGPWTRGLQNESMQLFCDLVKFYSDGRMEIEWYPGGQLGGHDEIFHSVQEGSTEIGIFTPYANLVPGGVLHGIPWTILNYNQCAVAYDHDSGIYFKVESEAWNEVGFHLLFVGLEGPYGIGNNVRPIKTPDDFKNLKMRVSPSLQAVRALENMGKGTGMTVTTIPWVDLYNALERGVVDGCWSIWNAMVEERHHEVLKYYTALGFLWGVNDVVVNQKAWDNLPEDLKKALEKAGKIAELREYEVHRRSDAEFIKTISEGGTEIYWPTKEELALFREKSNTPEIWEEFCTPYVNKLFPGQNMSQKMQDELDRIYREY